jgi:hypothetical protein
MRMLKALPDFSKEMPSMLRSPKKLLTTLKPRKPEEKLIRLEDRLDKPKEELTEPRDRLEEKLIELEDRLTEPRDKPEDRLLEREDRLTGLRDRPEERLV